MSQDMNNCLRCQRRTPAARGECIYCGESLPFASIQSAPPQRNIDPADHAFNTILEPFPARSPGRLNEAVVVSLASAMQLELSEVQALIASEKPVPLARSRTRAEAEMIVALVRTCGVRAGVVADEEMKLDRDLIRARRLILTDEQVRVCHSGAEITLNNDDIKLLVLGELRNKRVDYTEGIGRRNGQSSGVVDTSEYRSEETLLDVYTACLDRSFRIKSDAFDYSGLVSPLSVRSDMNFRAVVTTLRAVTPGAIVDEDFPKARRLLERAWPERTRNEPRGIKRTGLAFRPIAQASLISNHRDQFDRYSRLMFLSLARQTT